MPSPLFSTTSSARGVMPSRMKVLYITTPRRTGGWLTEAFAADSAAQIVLEEVVGEAAGLAKLRDEVFDAVLVSHDPGELDALDLVEGLRAGGSEEPMILLGSVQPEQIDALCYEVGADDYCCVAETTVRGLLWKFARAIERHQLRRENCRLIQAQRQRLQQEHQEAQRLLDQQRAIIVDLERLRTGTAETADLDAAGFDECHAKSAATVAEAAHELPDSLVKHYRDLLRAYVIMGAGNLGSEMSALAEHLAESSVSAQRTLVLHVRALEELVQGLGNRSARHVINRADLLVLEVMGHLADGYRQRYHERRHPPHQLPLPGFDPPCFGEPVSLRSAA
jgi:DNA-binding response OmpR family regulator